MAIQRRRRYHKPSAPVPPAFVAAVDEALSALAPVRRDHALPLLQRIQARLGYLPGEALACAARRSRIPQADLHALASFYDMLSTEPDGTTVVHLCDDIVCRCAPGARALAARLEREGWKVKTAPCLGLCDRAPAALVTSGGEAGGSAAYGGYQTWQVVTDAATTPGVGWHRRYAPVLLGRCGRYNPDDLAGYAAAGGLGALERARRMAPEALLEQVKASGLVGRGGAAFSTGIKWEGVAKAPTPLGPGPDGSLKYVVVNADESEPGTFTNRVLLEQDPLAVLESALIAAHAVGAGQIYIYIRGEYPLAIDSMTAAVATFAAAGLLGSVRAEVRCGSGAYICGEETALFASIEGERGEPRVKPPFPTTHGLFQRPTLINNVETLANLLPILNQGAAAWAAAPPKLFSISGLPVARPGVYEAPLGLPLQNLLDLAGVPAAEVQAVLVGGSSGMFLGPDQLQTPLSFKGLTEAGATLGSGAVMVFGHETDLWDVAARIARFFAEESCGKCVPCRIGTARQAELVPELATATGVGLHQDLALTMADASICGLGQTATNAIRSLLRLKGGR